MDVARLALLTLALDVPGLLNRLSVSLKTMPAWQMAQPSSDKRARIDLHRDQVHSSITEILSSSSSDCTKAGEREGEKEGACWAALPELQVTEIDSSFFDGSPEDAEYAFMQLAGPDCGEACFWTPSVRFGVAWQGPELSYLGHHHTAQELYIVLNGTSSWRTGSIPEWQERDHSFHMSDEHHAMRTNAEAALFFWSWTGNLELQIGHSPAEINSQLT